MSFQYRGEKACELTGMPVSHAKCFQTVADELSCMVSSRAVGESVTGLLEESYCSKGYHNKAKSCDWGPMAGFVMADERFTKSRDTTGQHKALDKALEWGASEIPLFISEARVQWLLKNSRMVKQGDSSFVHFDVESDSVLGKIKFRLISRFEHGLTNDVQLQGLLKSAGSKRLWMVNYHPESPNKGGVLDPVCAMVDPFCSENKGTYLSATTGDYDLFAIFPLGGESKNRLPGYARAGGTGKNLAVDQRPVTDSDIQKKSYQEYDQQEFTGQNKGPERHAGLGNITPRGALVMNKLNRLLQRAGYGGGNLVHHSDEAGRPMVPDVDLPFIGFVPGDTGGAYGIDTVAVFKEFIALCETKGLVPILNPGWRGQLGLI